MAMEEDARECWVCLEPADTGGAAAAPTGCACRGSAGDAHLSCLITAAQQSWKHILNAGTASTNIAWHAGGHAHRCMWLACPTCKQRYGGPVALGLARALGPLRRPRQHGW